MLNEREFASIMLAPLYDVPSPTDDQDISYQPTAPVPAVQDKFVGVLAQTEAETKVAGEPGTVLTVLRWFATRLAMP